MNSFEYLNTGSLPLAFKLKALPVFFSSSGCLDIIKTVLDENGKIKNFPGIIEDERWTSKRRIGIPSDVRFEAQFFALDNAKYLMLWMIQPNGWHWVDDDGFGFSGDSSIVLYSLIDESGSFLKEFELFSIDQTKYCDDFDDIL